MIRGWLKYLGEEGEVVERKLAGRNGVELKPLAKEIQDGIDSGISGF